MYRRGCMHFVVKAPRRTKDVGKVYIDQMHIKDSSQWTLSRISPKCENCNSNKYYNISCTSKMFILVIPYDKEYKITCAECGETIGLEFEEYLLLDPFVKVNKKYEEGKISRQEYDYKIEEIFDKYKLEYSRK